MDFSNSGINPNAIKRHEAMEKQMRRLARQIASQEAMMVEAEAGNQYIAAMIEKEMKSKAKSLEDRMNKEKAGVKEKGLFGMEDSEILSPEQGDLNPELDVKTLLILKSRLQDSDSTQDVIKKVLDAYSDHTLADDALSYLEKISEDKQIELVRKTRSEFNELFGREIIAGRNMNAEALAFSQAGLGSPTALRDLYREITGNPKTPNKLFEELAQRFDFQKLKKVIKFLLNSLGRDLKSKGSSIPKALLYRLLTESRNLQAILALYLFFKGRMNLLYRGFDQNDLYYPDDLTFELLAKKFMTILDDRYPSPVKIIKLAAQLGIEEDVIAQILIFTQFRDAVRNVAPKLFRSQKHRQEVLSALIDALEELDEALEDEEEEEE